MSNKQQILISIILPTYNHAKFLKKAVESGKLKVTVDGKEIMAKATKKSDSKGISPAIIGAIVGGSILLIIIIVLIVMKSMKKI